MARRLPAVRRQAKRGLLWADIIPRAAVAVLGAAKNTGNIGTSIGLVTNETITLVRTRGQLMVHFDPTTLNDVLLVGIGLGVYSDDAFQIGQSAMPGPISDPEWDWVYHKLFMLGPVFTATETGDSIQQNLFIELDSKAMRKMKANQTLGWIFEGLIHSGGGTVDISVVSRHLFMLA